MKVSIIIVYYRVKKGLFECINSIKNSTPKIPYEVIVVDNDEEQPIEKDLKKVFPHVRYIKSPTNIGYGAGNNLGASIARGELFFFLNPDTKIIGNAIDTLVTFYEKNKDIGIVAPLLFDTHKKPYPLQGSTQLKPLEGIIALSFLNTWFPGNPISEKYFLKGWNKKDIKEVDCVPGTAFVIKKKIFEKTGGFDEHLFLYFEEHDICNRVKRIGFKIFINPNACIVHEWEKSTRHRKDIDKIFAESRFYYFKKHFGIFSTLLVHVITSLKKKHVILLFILLIAGFARFYKLSELMPFIGDQGWFYLSAKDMLLTGTIPLVGITSSHTWLHQGPLWTYLLAVILYFSKFNPVSGAYFTAGVGIITVWLVYRISQEFFSERAGIIASLLYATSPLVILHSRMTYHTSFIPFFTILTMYSLYKWVKGNPYFFPFTIFFLSILYNFELATAVLWFVLLFFLIFGIWKKKKWVREIIHKKIILFSLFAFIIPMLPIFIYDISHGFKQTVVFAGWIGYKLISFPIIQAGSPHTFSDMFSYFVNYNQKLLFLLSGSIAMFMFLASIIYVLAFMHKRKSENQVESPLVILFLFLTIPLGGFLVNQTPSEAYLPVLFPTVIVAASLLIDYFLNFKKFYFFTLLLLITIPSLNIYYLISQNYFAGKGMYGPTFQNRIQAAQCILQIANEKRYSLIGKGKGSQFESFTMNYEYLLWWMGHPLSFKNAQLQFVIQESSSGIKIHGDGNNCTISS